MPEPRKVLATVERATELFRATPGRKGGLVRLDNAGDVMVVGDLHGNIPAFRRFLAIAGLDANPRRHLVLQELVHGPRMYPDDAGDRSHQLVDVVCALKCQYPERVHLILGNHELSELTNRPIAKGGVALNALFRRGIETAYDDLADAIYAAYLDLFASLPLACRTPNRVMVVHTCPMARGRRGVRPVGLRGRHLAPRVDLPTGAGLRHHLGPRHRPRERRPIRGDRRRRLLRHRPPAVRRPWSSAGRTTAEKLIIHDGTDPYPACCLFPANEALTIESLQAGVRVLPIED